MWTQMSGIKVRGNGVDGGGDWFVSLVGGGEGGVLHRRARRTLAEAEEAVRRRGRLEVPAPARKENDVSRYGTFRRFFGAGFSN